jgi:TRAP-type uncharacterized transport system fused permease subunit
LVYAIAAPAVQQLGVPPLAAHLFILYYGILADLTPPVCVAAYAAAGIAGSNPFRTGITAFRLGLAKATVPFVFAYSPAMLIMVDGFTWGDIGVLVLGIGMTGYAFTHMGLASQTILVISALLMISPNVPMTLAGVVLALPVMALNWRASKRAAPS